MDFGGGFLGEFELFLVINNFDRHFVHHKDQWPSISQQRDSHKSK
jgi:hypothetical protein